MDKNATYIVTGCTGYVGNVLAKKLMDEGCNVVGLARSEDKVRRVYGEHAPQIVYGDVTKQEDADRLFVGNGPFVVIHTVAKVSIGEAKAKEVYDVTVNGTRNIVDACMRHGAAKLLHISSTEVLPADIGEDADYRPDPKRVRKGYARAKCEADAVVLDAASRGLDASVLLLASVLGPGDYSNSHMTQMIIDHINGRLPASVNGGYNDFDIRDVADVLPAIIDKSERGQSYIFAHEPDKINDVLAVIDRMTGRKPLPTLPVWLAYIGLPFLSIAAKLRRTRPLYTSAALASIRAKADFPIGKSVRTFGYSPRPLEETVRDHVLFLAAHGMVELPS